MRAWDLGALRVRVRLSQPKPAFGLQLSFTDSRCGTFAGRRVVSRQSSSRFPLATYREQRGAAGADPDFESL
jgi:hypothetical protein